MSLSSSLHYHYLFITEGGEGRVIILTLTLSLTLLEVTRAGYKDTEHYHYSSAYMGVVYKVAWLALSRKRMGMSDLIMLIEIYNKV